MQWTAAEFFAGDGATTFTQRLASVLGIDITRVKIVSVYEGSLNVDVQILDNPDAQIVNENQTVTPTVATLIEMTQLNAKLVETLTTAAPSVLGAAILEVQTSVLTQYKAPVTTAGTSNNPFG